MSSKGRSAPPLRLRGRQFTSRSTTGDAYDALMLNPRARYASQLFSAARSPCTGTRQLLLLQRSVRPRYAYLAPRLTLTVTFPGHP